jgi:hypothetical protein
MVGSDGARHAQTLLGTFAAARCLRDSHPGGIAKGNPVNLGVHARTLVCAALLAILGACSSPIQSSSPEPTTSGSSSVSPKSADASPKAVSFSKSYRYSDGITVAITGVAHGQLGAGQPTNDPDAKEGDPYTVLSVTVHNGTAKSFDALFQGTLRYGNDKTVAYQMGLDDMGGVVTLAPGETSHSYDIGFLLPVEARDNIDLEISIDAGQHGPAAFTGSIAKARS